jgi:hypothetical protein
MILRRAGVAVLQALALGGTSTSDSPSGAFCVLGEVLTHGAPTRVGSILRSQG